MSYKLEDLLYLMERLRDPETGCAWDKKQSFSSIVPHTLEETYEVIDAIDHENWPNLKEELGDLLFQIVFYSQLGKEKGLFQFDGVIDGIVQKLLFRHPHVFKDGDLRAAFPESERREYTDAELGEQWRRLKGLEKTAVDENWRSAFFCDIPIGQNALSRAQKIQKKASSVGFDWQDIKPVLGKVQEEFSELEEEIARQEVNAERTEEELGDLLFSVVNLSRHLGHDAETALRKASIKFEKRFSHVEQILIDQNTNIESAGIDQMEEAWNQAKLKN